MYLNELDADSLGVSMVRLVTEPDEEVNDVLQQVVRQVKRLDDGQLQEQIIELVERMLVYRFPDFSTEVLQAMFTDTDLKKTRFYREVFQEGRQEGQQETLRQMVPRLRKRGFSLQEVADLLGVAIAEVEGLWHG